MTIRQGRGGGGKRGGEEMKGSINEEWKDGKTREVETRAR